SKVRVSLLFFFQAEDGIRDKLVTGVQTCALPISAGSNGRLPTCPTPAPSANGGPRGREPSGRSACLSRGGSRRKTRTHAPRARRSEERRVGKECRCGGWAGDSKKNRDNSWTVWQK